MSKKNTFRLGIIISLTLALTLLVIYPAFAGEIITGEHVRIIEDTTDDVYATGDTITIEATINGDLVAFGKTLTINGDVTGDVLFVGQALVINGLIEDDLRMAGMVILVNDGSVIGDDLIAGLFSLEMKPGSQVGGDVLFGAPQAVFGDVDGSVTGSSGHAVRFTGKVGGDVQLTLGGGLPVDINWFSAPALPAIPNLPEGLTFDRDGRIAGNLNYTSPVAYEISPDEVKGKVTFTPPEAAEPQREIGFIPPMLQRFFQGFFYNTGGNPFGWVLSNLILLLVAGLILQRFTPGFISGIVENLRTKTATSFGMGLLGYLGYWFVIIPLVVLFFFVLVVPLALIGAGGRLFDVLVLVGFSATVGFRVLARWVALIAIGLVVGETIYGLISKDRRTSTWPLLIGLMVITVLLVIPIFGDIILGALFSITGFGAAILYFRQVFSNKKPDENSKSDQEIS